MLLTDPVLYTAASFDPVTLDELKAHLRVTSNMEDADLDIKRKAAIDYVERITGVAMAQSTWEAYFDDFPGLLPKGYVSSITSVKYTDSGGTQYTVTSSWYELDNVARPCRINLAYGQAWPTGPFKVTNPIVVRFVAGWASGSVPDALKSAVLLVASDLYANREAQTMGTSGTFIAPNTTVQNLIAPYRQWRY